MKMSFFVIPALLTAMNVYAGTVTISSNANNPDPKLAALAEVPAELLGIFEDQGIKARDIGGGKFQLDVEAIHCDYRHNGAVEGARGGIPSQVCRFNSSPVKDSKKGKRLVDGRGLVSQLNLISNQDIGGVYTDCAMGYCGTWVKSISCTIDTNIDEFMKGRFVCTLVDEAT